MTEAARREFPPDGQSVAAARRFLLDTLHNWGDDSVEWVATQLISELATNAVLHARSAFTVTIEQAEGAVRLAVTDDSALTPRRRHYGEEATTGRGLALIEALATSWGFDFDGESKTVWCRVGATPGGHGIFDFADAGEDLDRWDAASSGDVAMPSFGRSDGLTEGIAEDRTARRETLSTQARNAA